MSARALDVLKSIDVAWEGIAYAPVVLVRMSREGRNSRDFMHACDLISAGYATPFHVDHDAGHIRRRANANRRRNKAARAARGASR